MKRVFWVVTLLGLVIVGPTMTAFAFQQGAAAVSEAATPPGGSSEWGNAAMWAFLSSSFLEWLKRNQRIAFVSERMAWGMQRLMGIGLAIATAAGVHASFDAATGVLTVTGLLWPSISEAAGESLRQWVFQEVAYRVAVKNYGKDQ